MKTVNSVERQRVTKRFAGFYAISVGLLGLIFAALSFGNDGDRSNGSVPGIAAATNAGLVEQERILAVSAPLQNAFKRLQEYDEQYAALLSQPNSGSKTDALRLEIRNTEAQLIKGIDNLQKSKKDFKEGPASRIVDRIAGTYALAMASRENMGMIRNAMSAGTKLDPGQQEILKLSTELSAKDKKIQELQDMLAASKDVPAATMAVTSSNDDDEGLKTAVVEAKKKTEQAVEQAANLRKENTRLTERINDLQRAGAPAAKPETVSSSRMESMTADLSFMQVDCNLTRADAKQIISNSRQRRDLLSEALKILNTLSRSDNPEVRKKAGERIAALNYIAKNIRE